MKSRNNHNNDGETSAKKRILEAASILFSEKGFDATGMDELAEKANVTKPLIYYYFEGKKEILNEIVKRYVTDINQKKQSWIGSLDGINEDTLQTMIDERAAFFTRDHKALKIIAMELLKSTSAGESLPDIIRPMVNSAIPSFMQMGLAEDKKIDLIITGLFFGTIPSLALLLYGDSFCKAYQIEKDELDRRYWNIVKTMYLDYYLSHFSNPDTSSNPEDSNNEEGKSDDDQSDK